MTVEMEQPFVWPETPNMEPWGNKEKEQEVKEILKVNDADGPQDILNSARILRKQVGMLLQKEEEIDPAIQSKKKAGLELTEDERLKLAERQRRKLQMLDKSPLKVWEERRTEKLVRSDEAERFSIKA